MHYIVMEILLIMEKSRNCVFECLLEPYTSKYLLIFADNRDPETAQSLHGEHKFRLAFSRGYILGLFLIHAQGWSAATR